MVKTYLTMNPEYEADILRMLSAFLPRAMSKRQKAGSLVFTLSNSSG